MSISGPSGLPGGREREPERRDEGRKVPGLQTSRQSIALPSLSQKPLGTTPADRRHTCPSGGWFTAGPSVSAAGRALSHRWCSRTRPPRGNRPARPGFDLGGKPGHLMRSGAAYCFSNTFVAQPTAKPTEV